MRHVEGTNARTNLKAPKNKSTPNNTTPNTTPNNMPTNNNKDKEKSKKCQHTATNAGKPTLQTTLSTVPTHALQFLQNGRRKRAPTSNKLHHAHPPCMKTMRAREIRAQPSGICRNPCTQRPGSVRRAGAGRSERRAGEAQNRSRQFKQGCAAMEGQKHNGDCLIGL